MREEYKKHVVKALKEPSLLNYVLSKLRHTIPNAYIQIPILLCSKKITKLNIISVSFF